MKLLKVNYKNMIKDAEACDMCFKCSSCSKFCPVSANVGKYDIENSYVVSLFTGEKDETLKDVWMCCACEKCQLVCALDANPPKVFANLKELSYKEGYAPESIYGVITRILNTGIAMIISSAVNRTRIKIGLNEITVNEGIVKDLKILAEKTGLKKKE